MQKPGGQHAGGEEPSETQVGSSRVGLLSQAEASSQLTGPESCHQTGPGWLRAENGHSATGELPARLGRGKGPRLCSNHGDSGQGLPLPEAGQLTGPLVGRGRVEGKERRR